MRKRKQPVCEFDRRNYVLVSAITFFVIGIVAGVASMLAFGV